MKVQHSCGTVLQTLLACQLEGLAANGCWLHRSWKDYKFSWWNWHFRHL